MQEAAEKVKKQLAKTNRNKNRKAEQQIKEKLDRPTLEMPEGCTNRAPSAKRSN